MIYFDNASTTKMDPDVIEVMNKAMIDSFANPSSLHSLGFDVEKKIRKARASIAKELGVKGDNLFFIPSGTIGNNAVINSCHVKGCNIVISNTEHSSIQELVNNRKDIEFRLVKTNRYGFVNEEDLLDKVDANTSLVSIIHVQNELGSINDINTLAKKVKEKNRKTLFHSDGVQGFKKIPVDLKDIDFYTISSHKINGPKGVAALYIKDPRSFNPLYFGGGQESGLFSSTENTYGILAFEKAASLCTNYDNVKKINEYLRSELVKVGGVKIISPEVNFSPYILNVCIDGIGAEVLLHYLEMDDIYISTGSACSRGKESKVLKAIGLNASDIKGCIRLSFDRNTSIEEAEEFVKKVENRIDLIRGMVKR